jgi:hypothetical protein
MMLVRIENPWHDLSAPLYYQSHIHDSVVLTPQRSEAARLSPDEAAAVLSRLLAMESLCPEPVRWRVSAVMEGSPVEN